MLDDAMGLPRKKPFHHRRDRYEGMPRGSDAVEGELFGLYQLVQEGAEAESLKMPGVVILSAQLPFHVALPCSPSLCTHEKRGKPTTLL